MQQRRDSEDGNAAKKPRVVWSVEMHQQFVTAVNQLGVESKFPVHLLGIPADPSKVESGSARGCLLRWGFFMEGTKICPLALRDGVLSGLEGWKTYVESSQE